MLSATQTVNDSANDDQINKARETIKAADDSIREKA